MSEWHVVQDGYHFPLDIVETVAQHGAALFAIEPVLDDIPPELHRATKAWAAFIYRVAIELERGGGCPVIIVFINDLEPTQWPSAMAAAGWIGYDQEIYRHGELGWYILLTKFGFRTMDYNVM